MVQQQRGSGPSAVFYIRFVSQKKLPGFTRQLWSRCAVTYSNLTTDMFNAEESAHLRSWKFNHHASYNLINRKNC